RAVAAGLGERTGISVGLEQPGGLQLCLGEEELEKRRAMMEQMRREAGNFGFEYRMLDRSELAGILPGLGASVAGASWTPYDGHANSLNLLHALHKGFGERGGTYLPGRTVIEAHAAPHDFRLEFAGETIVAPKIVRAWAALRVMPPDGLPIYDESEEFPGAFTANCHSGVTLAGAHANAFAPMVAAGALDPMMMPFSAKRFDVSAAA